MAKVLCIPSDTVDDIKKALKSGKISLPSLFDMNSSEERRAVWEPVTGKDLAKFINVKWEAAEVSGSKTAILDFVKEITIKFIRYTKMRVLVVRQLQEKD